MSKANWDTVVGSNLDDEWYCLECTEILKARVAKKSDLITVVYGELDIASDGSCRSECVCCGCSMLSEDLRRARAAA